MHSKSPRRRRGRGVAVVAALAMFAAGATQAAAPNLASAQTSQAPRTSPDDDSGQSASDVDPGGTVRIAMANVPPTGVPYATVGTPGQYVYSAVFDALTYMDADGKVAPALAESWESIDESTWQFNLRPDVTFHNGEPLTAEAVVATFDYLLSDDAKATYAQHTGSYPFIETVEAVDDTTVEITTNSPNPLLPNALAIAYIIPPAHWEEVGPEGFASDPVGTGPYSVDSWTDEAVELTRAPESWRSGGPDTLVYRSIGDPAARTQALQSGQVDVVQAVSPDQITTLTNEGFGSFVGHSARVMSLTLIANRGGPLADQRVRQALNYAVDKEAIAEALLGGISGPTAWPPVGVNGYDPDREPYPYDPDEARRLLEEAGYGDGFDMTAEIIVGSFPADREIYEATAGYLGEVGVNLTLQEIDYQQTWLPALSGSGGADWAGDAFGLTWGGAPLMDGIRPLTYFSCDWSNPWFCDETLDEMVGEVNAAFDPTERDPLLAELMDYTHEAAPTLWLVELMELWLYAPEISGWTVASYNPSFDQLRVDD